MALDQDVKAEIIAKYRREENDTGSAEVQIALLTEQIKVLTEHLKVQFVLQLILYRFLLFYILQ